MNGYYKLEGHTPVECSSGMEWAAWFKKANRHVAKDTIKGVDISTVFIGLDHSFGGGPPLLFETMVFGGELDQEMERYGTWEEAEAGHQLMKQRVEASVTKRVRGKYSHVETSSDEFAQRKCVD